MSEADLLQLRLDLEEKILKIANLQADTMLKQVQTRTEPWKVATASLAAGAAAAAALLAFYRVLGL